MSSSVFYESPSDSDCEGNDRVKKTTTDLVVVYRNNTINVNKQDLQDLLLGKLSLNVNINPKTLIISFLMVFYNILQNRFAKYY